MRLFLLESQETVAWVFVDDAICWKITWSAFATFFVFGEEVNSLWFATTESDLGFVQEVSDAFAVSVFVSHELIPP